MDATHKKNSIVNATLRGIIAGATGTVALDIATYMDMAIRGRSSSNAQSQMIDSIAKKLNLAVPSQGTDSDDKTAIGSSSK